MKIRTDFVTNSSSSSFIFTVGDLFPAKEKVKEAISKRLEVEYYNSCKGDDLDKKFYRKAQKWFEEQYGFEWEFNYINEEMQSVSEFPFAVIDEVYSWYHEEITDIAMLGLDEYMKSEHRTGIVRFLDMIGDDTGDYFAKSSAYREKRKQLREQSNKEYIECIRKRNLSSESIERLMGAVILEYYSEHYNSYDGDDPIFSESIMDEMYTEFLIVCVECICYADYDNSVLFEFFVTYYDTLSELAKDYYGMKAGEILDKVIGSCFMNFEEYEWPNPYLGDALASLPICVMWCRHMG